MAAIGAYFDPQLQNGERERKMFRGSMSGTRKLPFGAIAAAQWLSTRPVAGEVRVCMYLIDRP